MLEFVDGVNIGHYLGKHLGVIQSTVIEAGRIDKMNFVFDTVLMVREDVILDVLGHLRMSVNAQSGILTRKPFLPNSPPSISSCSPIGIVGSSVTTDMKVLLPAPVRPITRIYISMVSGVE